MFGSQKACRIPTTVVAVLVLAVAGLAQSTENAPAETQTLAQSNPSQFDASARLRARQGRRTTCWRQAGILPEIINERWKIQDEAKAKIHGVCTDPKLTPEQRVARIHLIGDDAEKEFESLVTHKQLSTYKACEAEREMAMPKTAEEKKLGPCGGTIPATKDHDAADSEMNHPNN